MARPDRKLPVYSHQGFVLYHVRRGQAQGLLSDPTSGVTEVGGRLVKTDYQRDHETSPSAITVTDMRMNAGEYGKPKPSDKRRAGYIDAIEAAREKIAAWRGIGGESALISEHAGRLL